jgi:acyl-CoA synthetase (NDP forming)
LRRSTLISGVRAVVVIAHATGNDRCCRGCANGRGRGFGSNGTRSHDDSPASWDRIGYPIVLKIASPEIVHKSDIGGIRVGLRTPEALAEAYDEVIDRARAYARDEVIDGVYVQAMAPAGREVIIGIDRDPIFGPLLMFGLGGIYVEVMKDVTFRLCPVSAEEARR